MHIATLYKVRPAITLLCRISRDSDWTKIREGELPSVPSLYRGTFEVTEEPKDTFLHMKGWTKGVCFINGHNLGRYWKIGPQETLYLPAPWLNKGRNEVCYLTWNTVKSNFEFFEPRTMVTLQESFATDRSEDIGSEKFGVATIIPFVSSLLFKFWSFSGVK